MAPRPGTREPTKPALVLRHSPRWRGSGKSFPSMPGALRATIRPPGILWDYPWPGQWPKCAQPIILPPDRIFLSASFNAGGKLSVIEKWKNRSMKSEFSNIVVRDGCAYGLDDG